MCVYVYIYVNVYIYIYIYIYILGALLMPGIIISHATALSGLPAGAVEWSSY